MADTVKKEEGKKEEGKQEQGIGVDVGTSTIVVARRDAGGGFSIKYHRNMLFEVEASGDAESFLKNSSFLYIKEGDRYYIVGDDALKIVNIMGTGEIVRPMQNGLLNPDLKKARQLLFYILKACVGKPIAENEALRFSAPANPIDEPNINNEFHCGVLKGFFDSLGFLSEPINEALSNLYAAKPVMKVEGEADKQLTGYSLSLGGGMANSCIAMGGYSLEQFSVTKCGDHIDRQVARATGVPAGKVMRIKETQVDLSKINQSDDVQVAISIYYDEMITRVVRNIGKRLSAKDRDFPGAMEVVVCGGTSMIPGFIPRLERILEKTELPFKVAGVRMSKQPFFSVSQGACMVAASDMEKRRG